MPSPLDPRAWNRFSYVYGNPVNYTDPSGHIACAGACIGAIAIGVTIGAVTGAFIGGGLEYTAQSIETGDWTLQNKERGKIYLAAGVGAFAGGITGGVGSVFSSGVRAFFFRMGTSAIINPIANASYVGIESYYLDENTFDVALIETGQYLQKNLSRDLIVGAIASGVADILSVAGTRVLNSLGRINSRYVPMSFSDIDYRHLIVDHTRRPVSGYWAFGGAGLSSRQFARIPWWYSSLRSATLVFPDAVSNTGLIGIAEERLQILNRLGTLLTSFN